MSRSIELKLTFLVLLVICVFVGLSSAQSVGTERKELPRGDQISGFDAASSSSDSSSNRYSWVTDYLATHPDLLGEVKRAVVARLREQGTAVEEASISDKMLLDRLERDETARKVAAEWLASRGYVGDSISGPDEDGDLSNDEVTDRQNVPRFSQRRSVGRKPSDDNEEVDRGTTLLNSDSYRDREPADNVDRLPSDYSTDRPEGMPNGSTNKNRSRLLKPREIDSDEVQKVRPPSVYSNVPSYKDLYSQLPQSTSKLTRFGGDLFRRGTDVSRVTMDLPVGPDYVLGPGDGLNLEIWGGVSQRISRTVDREGRLALPEAGPVVVAGQTLAQAQKLIQDALRPQFRDARVDVTVARVRTVRVYVVGDVQRPGPYDISSLSTPLNALYAAGGPTARGSLRTVKQYRGKQLIRELDLYEMLLHGVRSDVDRLQSGDTILVPPVGAQVTVSGMVRRPAIYELRDETNLSDVIQLAGGLLVTATLQQITVERIEAHNKRVLLSLDVPEKSDGNAVSAAMASFKVADGDKLQIFPILSYSEATVYLQGHAFRPGKYSYRDGLTVNDVIKSYQDLLPEPASHAEIIRLTAPDYRPETLEFNLDDVLSGDDPIQLKPFDTIRVFGRYEIDAPMVYMYGEVLRPGRYPLAAGMTAAALVRMAGGFKRSAYKEIADITSYTVTGESKIETGHRTFGVAKALTGEKDSDVVLKPGDVVTVRQLPGWKDIGASVTLNGEITYAGTYGIKEGERLSSVLKRAGGFRPAAYPVAAIFERIEVKELAEKSRAEMIRRIESSGSIKLSLSASGQDQAALLQAMMQQQQQVLARLRNQPVVGRMVINISENISTWENTSADIQLRAGDVITIPKRPQFVLVTGQVYNSSAQSYMPGKTAGWYLSRAGGATDMANKKSLYIVRSNGSVISKSSGGWFKGDVLSTKMQPGDVLVVPEKIVGGSAVWKNVLSTAQFVSSVAFAAAALGNL